MTNKRFIAIVKNENGYLSIRQVIDNQISWVEAAEYLVNKYPNLTILALSSAAHDATEDGAAALYDVEFSQVIKVNKLSPATRKLG